jgi:hypothetical protein
LCIFKAWFWGCRPDKVAQSRLQFAEPKLRALIPAYSENQGLKTQ